MHQLKFTFPWQDVGVSIIETQRDFSPGISAAVSTNHSDLWERHGVAISDLSIKNYFLCAKAYRKQIAI